MNGTKLTGKIGHIKKEIKLLLYCTKSKPRLFFDKLKQIFSLGKIKSNNDLNGKIVAECDFEVEKIKYFDDDFGEGELYTETLNIEELEKRSCVGRNDLSFYLTNKYSYEGYAIHIKNLHTFDEPKELSEYKRKDEFMGGKQVFSETIKKAPQNMMYAWLYTDKWNRYVIISIQPQWMCKILNGEKTIEVRKKVLKEMIG